MTTIKSLSSVLTLLLFSLIIGLGVQAQQNRLPKGVRSWVIEFKRNRGGESRIAFDNLFKDALSQSGQSD